MRGNFGMGFEWVSGGRVPEKGNSNGISKKEKKDV